LPLAWQGIDALLNRVLVDDMEPCDSAPIPLTVGSGMSRAALTQITRIDIQFGA